MNASGRRDADAGSKDRLVSAMRDLAGEYGPRGITVAELCRQAGVPRGAFVELFADQDDLFACVVERELDALTVHVEAAAEDARRADQPVGTAAITAFFTALDADPRTAWLCVIEPMGTGRRARDARERASTRLSALLDSPATGGAAGRPRGSSSFAPLWEMAYQHLVGADDAGSLSELVGPAIARTGEARFPPAQPSALKDQR